MSKSAGAAPKGRSGRPDEKPIRGDFVVRYHPEVTEDEEAEYATKYINQNMSLPEAAPGEWKATVDAGTGGRIVWTCLGLSALLGLIAVVIPAVRTAAAILAVLPIAWLLTALHPSLWSLSNSPFRFLSACKSVADMRFRIPPLLTPIHEPPVRDASDTSFTVGFSPGQHTRMQERRAEFIAEGFRSVEWFLHKDAGNSEACMALETFEHPCGISAVLACIMLNPRLPSLMPFISLTESVPGGETIGLTTTLPPGIFPKSRHQRNTYVFPPETSVQELCTTHRVLLRTFAPTFASRRPSIIGWDKHISQLNRAVYDDFIARGCVLQAEQPDLYRLSRLTRLRAASSLAFRITPLTRFIQYRRTRAMQRRLGGY